MGQFDADIKQISSFEVAGESTGISQSLNSRREYLLDINGMTTDNRLTMTITYNETHFKPGTISALMDQFESELRGLIAFCCSKERIENTPSDFTYKGLSIESIDRLTGWYPNLEDLYTLTPMQEGMLFHAASVGLSHYYFEQMSYRLQGELDIRLVEKSLNELLKRHDILRTAFVYKEIEHPVQVVLKDRSIDFYYEDITKIGAREVKENFAGKFKAKDRDRSFDLSKDVLMRVSILRMDNWEYEFIWSFHHILMDGWCLGILNSDFFEIYNSYLEKRAFRLPEVKPYRRFIQWLAKQDKKESIRYWESLLDSFEEQTGVPKTKTAKKGETGYKNESISVVLNSEKTAGLNKLAGDNHVTVNTVARAIWGILLGKYNGKCDVAFGAVVSGRPYELEGVETMVGLFINAIPVRIRFEEQMSFRTLLRQTWEEALSSEPHHHTSLAEIQAVSSLKQDLIDHLFGFENYPLAEQLEGYGSGREKSKKLSFKVTDLDIFEQAHYDLNISISGSDRLIIKFQYNGKSYDHDYLERLVGHLLLAFDRVMENDQLEIRELSLLSEEEKHRILYEFNNTETEYPKDKTIHGLFVEQVERMPDRIAVVGPPTPAKASSQITYREYRPAAAIAASGA